ncbi:hypothetical protein HY087_02100 [Candidatus Gottesmanbacteria bacterium]|nr:hypothetical protein [Candidatus Gottesmanbacteria bacterium]MBI3559895.1 hypothetical protein [Candidatus Gottesmanbacteria bacterium]
MADPNTENPVEKQERGPEAPVVGDVREVFETKAKEVGVRQTYIQEFQKIKDQIPENQRGSLSVRYNEWYNGQVGRFAEYGARFNDWVHNVLHPSWLIKNIPRNPNQQIEKVKARAAAEVTAEKTRLQVAEHEAFKDMIPFGGGKLIDIGDRILGPSVPGTAIDAVRVVTVTVPTG